MVAISFMDMDRGLIFGFSQNIIKRKATHTHTYLLQHALVDLYCMIT